MAARRGSRSRWNATSSTATSAASGRRRCPTSSITRPTGRPSARRHRRTGGNSISCFRGNRMKKRLMTTALAFAAAAASFGAAPPAQKLSGGNGTMYVSGWPNKIYIVDEAQEKVTGAIETATGTPSRMTLTRDRSRVYFTNTLGESVEIVDLNARRSVDHFTLSEGRKKVRIRGMIPDPLNRFVILLTK